MFGFLKNKKLLVTHGGKFHCDDIFACATIQIYLDEKGQDYKLVRTRDEEIIERADYVFDVGGIHDASKNRFDHHQKGGAGERQNGIPYASFGLVWDALGERVCKSKEIKNLIEEELVCSIDADDNGQKLFNLKGNVSPFRLQEYFYAFRPTWKEEPNYDEIFIDLVQKAKQIIKRLIKKSQDYLEAKVIVEEKYQQAEDKRLIIFDVNLPPAEHVLVDYPEPLYIISPRPEGTWRVGIVPNAHFSFESRKPLPESWAGLRDEDLQKVTGVSDAVFCHNGRFMAVAKTREGALVLAKLALES